MSVDNCSDSSDSVSIDYDDDESFERTKIVRDKDKYAYYEYERRKKPPIFSARVPFEELRDALAVLKSDMPQKSTKCNKDNSCNLADKTTVHFCYLIKCAILRHQWRVVPKLLIEYMNQKKKETVNITVILKYTLMFLLNDPVAKKHKLLIDFFNSILLAHDDEERKKILRILTITK